MPKHPHGAGSPQSRVFLLIFAATWQKLEVDLWAFRGTIRCESQRNHVFCSFPLSAIPFNMYSVLKCPYLGAVVCLAEFYEARSHIND